MFVPILYRDLFCCFNPNRSSTSQWRFRRITKSDVFPDHDMVCFDVVACRLDRQNWIVAVVLFISFDDMLIDMDTLDITLVQSCY